MSCGLACGSWPDMQLVTVHRSRFRERLLLRAAQATRLALVARLLLSVLQALVVGPQHVASLISSMQ